MAKSGLSYDKKQFAAVADLMAEKIKNLENLVEFQFSFIGLKTATNAKEVSTFQNQTGNLRSSIGFVLAKNGEIIEVGGFTRVSGNGENMAIVNFTTKEGKEVSFHAKGKSGDGQSGVKVGREYAEELARSSGKGYVLIIVAGMNYAGYVEAKGYNVLTESGKYLESEANKMIERILKKAGFR
jgi:alpha-L-fucosidase